MKLDKAINIVVYGGQKPENVSQARWNAIVRFIKREFLNITE